MITGTITPDREAVVVLRILDGNSQEQPLDTVVDTGFDGYLTLPPDLTLEIVDGGPVTIEPLP